MRAVSRDSSFQIFGILGKQMTHTLIQSAWVSRPRPNHRDSDLRGMTLWIRNRQLQDVGLYVDGYTPAVLIALPESRKSFLPITSLLEQGSLYLHVAKLLERRRQELRAEQQKGLSIIYMALALAVYML